MYAIYDLKENEQCIAVFDTRTRKHKRKWRYLIQKIDEE